MKRLFYALALAVLASCTAGNQVKLLPVSDFETLLDGKEVTLYTLKNADLTMQVTNFGARVVSDRKSVV